MKSIFYILLFSQLLNFLGVFAEKVKEDSSGMNSVIWEKVEENKSKPLKKIIWKSYKSDENYFKMKIKKVFQLIKFLGPNQPRLSLLLGAIEHYGFPLRKLKCQMLANIWVCTV